VVELDFTVRQNNDQVDLKSFLKILRVGWTSENDRHRLKKLCLDDDRYTSQETKNPENALHLCRTHKA
jgi:hypothetical protein